MFCPIVTFCVKLPTLLHVTTFRPTLVFDVGTTSIVKQMPSSNFMFRLTPGSITSENCKGWSETLLSIVEEKLMIEIKTLF